MTATGDLGTLFHPRAVALVGASDRNPWCALTLASLQATNFSGPIYLVNKSGGQALGRSTVTSCKAIGEPVDAVFVAVPASALEEAIEDIAAAGIRHGVVVTSGFAEIGEAGAAEQARVFARARELGLKLLGPNSLGVMNCVDGAALTAIPVPDPLIRGGRVGLISQSGATTSALQEFAARQGVGFTYSVALGNEADVDLAQVVAFMVEDDTTRAIAIYVEAIRDSAGFIRACQAALAARKPVVVLKVGVGALAAEVAQAHTGALVGDDKVFDSVCRRYGVIRVRSLEQLILTADFLAYTGVMEPRPIAAMSMSGGACGMIADMGEAAGVPFAKLTPETLAKLRDMLPPYGSPNNPLDITGAAMAETTLFSRSLDALVADPGVGLVLCLQEAAQNERTATPLTRSMQREIGLASARADKPVLMIGQTSQQSTAFGRDLLRETGIPFASNPMAEIIKSVAAGRGWSDRVRAAEGRPDAGRARTAPAPATERPVGERQTLDYLAGRGVPVVPARIVASAAEASAAAHAVGGQLALKILSPDIAHKTEAGGVVLDVAGPAAAAIAYDRIMADVTAARPDAHLDGVLVSPMRQRDLELFVGVARDPIWGLALAVGLGGVWVELLADVALTVLPVTPQDVLGLLGELKASRLLDGYRGAPPVDREALARVVAAVGDAALALGPGLASLEINPLNVGPAGIEALDALAVWA